MTTLLEALLLRDLQDRWVLPRLLYAVAIHTAGRAVGRSFAFLSRPSRQVSGFLRTLHEHPGKTEIVLAGLAVLAGLLRAWALLVLALAGLILAVSKL